MRGKIRFYFKNKKRSYSFILNRNITIINDFSGTGKSSFIRDLHNGLLDVKGRRHILKSDGYDVKILNDSNWDSIYAGQHVYTNTIFFIDEQNPFLVTQKFAKFVSNTGAYFVIITRAHLSQLSYSVEEIYEFNYDKDNDLYTLKPKYDLMCNDIKNKYYLGYKSNVLPALIITEDTGSGFSFFESLGINCIGAGGNAEIFKKVKENLDKNLFVIGDGAAFGAYIDDLVRLQGNDIRLFLPESFEYMILKSKIYYDKDLNDVLHNTWKYVEYKKYSSWERYFTKYLVDISSNTSIPYKKSGFRKGFLNKGNIKKILDLNELSFLSIVSESTDEHETSSSKSITRMNLI